ncbi:MAG: hypothetical protein KGI29_06445 [Pseudomonadota bacterium]|nr:hypothetical protein [Pseudomonadota bacterium]MDE3037470.1 hypothetical protein [Pseudomonadota bacterium]
MTTLEDSGETTLARRFSRALRPPEKITCEFTRDAGLLHQYFRLREEMFITTGASYITGKQDEFDGASEIIVARRGLHCVAGGRLTISAPSHRQALPMENKGIKSLDLIPEFMPDKRAYGELSRLTVLPEFGETLPEIIRRVIKKAVAERVEYIFNIAPKPLAESARHAAQLFGVNWEIRSGITVPDSEEYEGKMVLSIMDLTGHVRRPPAARARREKVMAG